MFQFTLRPVDGGIAPAFVLTFVIHKPQASAQKDYYFDHIGERR